MTAMQLTPVNIEGNVNLIDSYKTVAKETERTRVFCEELDKAVAQSAALSDKDRVTKRAELLDTAKGYVTKDRQATHGDLEDSFGRTAKLWSAHLGIDVSAVDVTVLMALLKVARIGSSPKHEDNWVDLAGYAACGGELACGKENGD